MNEKKEGNLLLLRRVIKVFFKCDITNALLNDFEFSLNGLSRPLHEQQLVVCKIQEQCYLLFANSFKKQFITLHTVLVYHLLVFLQKIKLVI